MLESYVCEQDCVVNNPISGPVRIKEGDTLEVNDFDVVECSVCDKDKDGTATGKVKGQLCHACKGTRREFPPYHCSKIGEATTEVRRDTIEWETQDALRDQLKTMGRPVDLRWGIDRLRAEVAKGRRGKK